MPEFSSIDEVLTELDRIVELTLQEDSPLGIFAWVYRRTTAKVAEGIRQQRFEDNERMERFDIIFASLYIEAFRNHRQQQSVSSSWAVAFKAASPAKGPSDAVIMQHLLLGMNAHINLDLGIAAAKVSDRHSIGELEDDFMTINLLLEELIDEMQHRISRVSPLMFLLDLIGKRSDEEIVNWSMVRARRFAWNFACTLAGASDADRDAHIRRADGHITDIARCVAEPPGWLLPNVLRVIRYVEEKDIRKVIMKLKD